LVVLASVTWLLAGVVKLFVRDVFGVRGRLPVVGVFLSCDVCQFQFQFQFNFHFHLYSHIQFRFQFQFGFRFRFRLQFQFRFGFGFGFQCSCFWIGWVGVGTPFVGSVRFEVLGRL
jgi:hypothetical protein